MKITCITTTFNDGELLTKSIQSILNQSYQDFQLIIVDDGSDVETQNVIAQFNDPRIDVIRQANDGLSAARNKALEQVTGDYVCFLDADDIRPNWSLRAIADLIKREDPDLIFCRGTLCDVNENPVPFYDTHTFNRIQKLEQEPDKFGALRTKHLAQILEPQSANKVVRTSMLRENGIQFPNTHYFEDVFFHTVVLSKSQKTCFLHSPCFTYFRRYVGKQITASTGEIRLDIIAVTKLTLEVFAASEHMSDPIYRGAVIASCFKILRWCEKTISHHYRDQFRQATKAVLVLMDQKYLQFPNEIPDLIPEIETFKRYIHTVRDS